MLIKKWFKKIKNTDIIVLLMISIIVVGVLIIVSIISSGIRGMVCDRLNWHYNDMSKVYYFNMTERQDGDYDRVREQMAANGNELFFNITIWTREQGIKDRKLYDYAYDLYMLEKQKQEEKEEKELEIYKKDNESFQDRLIHIKGEK